MGSSDENEGLGVPESQRKKQRKVLDKASGKGLERNFAQANREAVEAVASTYAPPIIVESRCAVCSGPFAQYRVWIEHAVVKSFSYSAIARRVPPSNDGRVLDRRSISRHAKEHMKIEDAAARAMLEEEANLLRQNVDTGVQGAMSTRGALKVLVQRAYNDALAGITTVEPRDMVQMIKLLHDLEANTSTSEAEEAKAALTLFSKAIRNVAAKRRDDSLMVDIRNEIQRLRQMDEVDTALEDNLNTPRLVGLPAPEPVQEATVIDNSDDPKIPTT